MGIALMCLIDYSLINDTRLQASWKPNWYTNLLICATRSVKFHSQAYILTTRIPVMISFIISNRPSVTAADWWRTLPALWAANAPYATTRRKTEAPIKACHATRYHKRTIEATMSSGTNGNSNTGILISSIALASLETRLIVFSGMASSKVYLVRLRIWKIRKDVDVSNSTKKHCFPHALKVQKQTLFNVYLDALFVTLCSLLILTWAYLFRY